MKQEDVTGDVVGGNRLETMSSALKTADVIDGLTAAIEEMQRIIVGQDKVLRHALAACLAGGHVLFEDVPGTGKTTLAATMAKVMGLHFTRVQGTPDLLPSELVGTMVFRPDKAEFEFRAGPVFTQVLLMDEVNRATPRTQSALLEAMSEQQVTVDGVTRRLDAPFFVMATANPLESQGVFPLPEAQLDRFLVQLRLGYVSLEDELEMVRRIRLRLPIDPKAVLNVQKVLEARTVTRNIYVAEDLIHYIVELCRASRVHDEIALGASPRSVLYLTSFCQALALLSGRDYILPDDVKEAWLPVMRHRMVLRSGWNADDGVNGSQVDDILNDVLHYVAVPTEIEYGAHE
ncbi:AAA family ATPase [Alicyclobacillus ferrooxydans]|uniref:AAA family ATPase n=1 Tax=Alicyclobacillus ferrooxydans TaxID=471514 RepID=UPI001FE014E5|nr:MoxR family ATPase [Alicyclobacillus ferrooxydans]